MVDRQLRRVQLSVQSLLTGLHHLVGVLHRPVVGVQAHVVELVIQVDDVLPGYGPHRPAVLGLDLFQVVVVNDRNIVVYKGAVERLRRQLAEGLGGQHAKHAVALGKKEQRGGGNHEQQQSGD